MDREIKLVFLIVFIAVGTIFVSIFGLFEDMMYIPTVTGENISTYKTSCAEIDLNKPQDDLVLLSGQTVKIKGKFILIFEGGEDRTIFMLKPYNLTYYPHVAISYSSKVPFNEGDELIVYGQYDSFLSYSNTTVPFIKGAYIEKI